MQDPVDPNQAQNPANPAGQDPQTGGTPVPPTPPTPPMPPAGDQGAAPVAGQAAQGGGNLGGIMEDNVDVGNLIQNAGNPQQQQDFISRVTIPPHPNTQFDEQQFVQLLAGSISLTVGEKERIIQAIPQLSQFQIDELIKIFNEEKVKFQELEKKHAEQVAALEKEHAQDWQNHEEKKEEEAAQEQESSEADDIRKNLGL